MNANTRRAKLAAKTEADAARAILMETASLLSEEDVDEQTVLFLLDRAQSAISKCRSAVERRAESATRDSERGGET